MIGHKVETILKWKFSRLSLRVGKKWQEGKIEEEKQNWLTPIQTIMKIWSLNAQHQIVFIFEYIWQSFSFSKPNIIYYY